MDVGVMLAELIPQVPSNVFTKWLSKRVSIIWLDSEDGRLGMTRFEEGNAELVRRRRLKLDPGEITIGLHPRLVDEPDLLRHTLAHELIHASGVLNHSKELHDAVENIAPGVSISKSPIAAGLLTLKPPPSRTVLVGTIVLTLLLPDMVSPKLRSIWSI